MLIFVIHDRDGGTPGAESFNAPIAAAVGDASKVIMLEECIEDLLGYPAPSGENRLRRIRKHSAGEITGMTCLNH